MTGAPMTRADRPARTYRTGPATRVLRWVAVLAMVAVTAWLLVAYPTLPETVVTHFGPGGEADDWGPKWSLLVVAGVMLLLSLPLAAISAHPRAFNYPVEITESNAQTMYREGERLMVWTLLFLQVIYLGIGWSVVLGGGGPLLVIGVAGLLGASILAIVRMVRAAR